MPRGESKPAADENPVTKLLRRLARDGTTKEIRLWAAALQKGDHHASEVGDAGPDAVARRVSGKLAEQRSN